MMKTTKLISCAFISFLLSISCSHAAVISIDWQSSGDGLITRDDISGLDWLDLIETNGMSRDSILNSINGGSLNGWRYASVNEVIGLWTNFGIDLSSDAPVRSYAFDNSIVTASNLLGNTLCEHSCSTHPYGALGLTNQESSVTPGHYKLMGAYYNQLSMTSEYVTDDGNNEIPSYASGDLQSGHYLVRTSAVPVPAAIWLFLSGLSGLIFLRKNKSL